MVIWKKNKNAYSTFVLISTNCQQNAMKIHNKRERERERENTITASSILLSLFFLMSPLYLKEKMNCHMFINKTQSTSTKNLKSPTNQTLTTHNANNRRFINLFLTIICQFPPKYLLSTARNSQENHRTMKKILTTLTASINYLISQAAHDNSRIRLIHLPNSKYKAVNNIPGH